MMNDIYGRQILTEDDIFLAFLRDPDFRINNGLVNTEIKFDPTLELVNIPKVQPYKKLNVTIEEFDEQNQNNWYMPDEYKNMDIAKWVLDQCKEDHELQRVGEELLLYQDRNLFPLLCYCKYLVDTMREHKIVWGVGRGSSVASYVLYLIGIHRVNSIFYDLHIDEFLK
jgi:DNA polymerase III alpha subunit